MNIKSRENYLGWRSRFIVKLALFHFALVLGFDFLAIFAPSIITAPAWGDSVFTVGLVFALFIVLSVIFSTFYYAHRISKEESSILAEAE